MEVIIGGLKIILWFILVLFLYLYARWWIERYKKEEEKEKRELERYNKLNDELKSSNRFRAPSDNNPPRKAEK